MAEPLTEDDIKFYLSAIPRNVGGVYLVLNRVNKKKYVGSTVRSIRQRCKEHISDLKAGRHKNKHLQSAWNKYGPAAFRFSVLEVCTVDKCIDREQHWIDHYNSADQGRGYNSAPKAGSTAGIRHTEEARKRIREGSNKSAAARSVKMKEMYRREEWRRYEAGKGNRGRVPSSEEVAKRNEAVRKAFADDPTIVARRAALNTGKKRSEEQRKRISKGIRKAVAEGRGNRKGCPYKRSAETRRKLSLSHLGKRHSILTRLKISQTMKRKKGMVKSA